MNACIPMAVTLLAAPLLLSAAAPKSADQLAKENAQKVSQLVRPIESTFSWPNDTKAKNFAQIVSNVNELVRLATLKEGAPANMTVFKAKMLLAKAYTKPVNLRFRKEAEAALADALKAAATPEEKAAVEAAREAYLVDIGEKEPAKKSAAKKPDVSDQAALRAWYRERTRTVSWNDARDPLLEENCPDGMIRACDEAIAELKDAGEFRLRKAALLAEGCQWAEAEKIYLEELAKVIDLASPRRIEWLSRLADLYVQRAARYYERPDAKLTAKAVWYWEEILRINPKDAGTCRKIVEQMFYQADWAAARKWLDAYVAVLKDAKPDAWASACYGDLAFFAGDYEEAVRCYTRFEKFPDGPSIVRIPNSHQRFAGALFATGRYAECLKAVDQCPNMWSFKDTNDHYRKILAAKIAAEKK